MADIGARLRLTRLALGLSQRVAAKESGVERSAWSNWETGLRPLDSLAAARFAERYEVALDWIFRGRLGVLRHELAEKVSAMSARQQETPARSRKKARRRHAA